MTMQSHTITLLSGALSLSILASASRCFADEPRRARQLESEDGKWVSQVPPSRRGGS